MKTANYTTRTQLKGYGASQYQARVITKNIIPIGKQGNAYTYSLNDVITSIREYLKRSRIKPKTRQFLEFILQTLLERLGNIVQLSFVCSTDPELSQLTKQLFSTLSSAEAQSAELKAMLATIKGKY